MRERTRISGSNLGVLAFDKACRRCFWLMQLIGSKFPYRFGFPGVMFGLDRLEKNIVAAALEHNGAAPEWMGDLASAESVFSNKPLLCKHESGMTLSGIPDAVFAMPDGSLGLVDYKTARFRGPDDPLLTKYLVQLAAYTYLLEETHDKKVSKAGLLYFQAETGAEGIDLLSQLNDSGFSVKFSAHWLPIEVDRDQVGTLLNEAYGLATTNDPPAAGEGCKSCANLLRITELLDGIKEPLIDVRQLTYLSQAERARLGARMGYLKSRLEITLTDIQETLEDARQDNPWSVIGLWDFADDKNLS